MGTVQNRDGARREVQGPGRASPSSRRARRRAHGGTKAEPRPSPEPGTPPAGGTRSRQNPGRCGGTGGAPHPEAGQAESTAPCPLSRGRLPPPDPTPAPRTPCSGPSCSQDTDPQASGRQEAPGFPGAFMARRHRDGRRRSLSDRPAVPSDAPLLTALQGTALPPHRAARGRTHLGRVQTLMTGRLPPSSQHGRAAGEGAVLNGRKVSPGWGPRDVAEQTQQLHRPAVGNVPSDRTQCPRGPRAGGLPPERRSDGRRAATTTSSNLPNRKVTPSSD